MNTKHDIPLIVLVGLLVTCGNLLWNTWCVRSEIASLKEQCDNKQQTIDNLLELNNGLMRENLAWQKGVKYANR